MTTQFFASLDPEAQEDLIRDSVIELVTVAVRAVPDPSRPDDRGAMTLVVEIGHDFQEGISWIDAELARIREISNPAGEDLSPDVRYLLLKDLNRRRDELAEIRAGRIDGKPIVYFNDPFYQKLLHSGQLCWDPDVLVWCHCWSVAMDDDGKLILDTEPPLLFDKIDAVSRDRIYERVVKVDMVIGDLVRRLLG